MYSFIKYDAGTLSTSALQSIGQAYRSVLQELLTALQKMNTDTPQYVSIRKQYLQFRRATMKISDELGSRSAPAKKIAVVIETAKKPKKDLPPLPDLTVAVAPERITRRGKVREMRKVIESAKSRKKRSSKRAA